MATSTGNGGSRTDATKGGSRKTPGASPGRPRAASTRAASHARTPAPTPARTPVATPGRRTDRTPGRTPAPMPTDPASAKRIARLEAELEGLRRSVEDFGGDRRAQADAQAHARDTAGATDGWIVVPPTATYAAPPAYEPYDPNIHGQTFVDGTDGTVRPGYDEYGNLLPADPGAWGQETAPPGEPKDVEMTLGLKWLPVAGTIIVVLGISLYLALFGREIPAALRFTLGLAAAGGFWAWGWRLSKNNTSGSWLGDTATAGGAAIAYYCFFAVRAFTTFQKELGMPVEVAVAGMAAVVVLLTLDAFVRHRQALAATALILVPITAFVANGAPGVAPEALIAYETGMMLAVLVLCGLRNWTATAIASVPTAYVLLLFHGLWAGTHHDVGAGWMTATCALVLLAGHTALPWVAEARKLVPGYGQTGIQVGAWLGAWVVLMVGLSATAPTQWRTVLGSATAFMAFTATGLALLPNAHKAARVGWAVAAAVLLAAWPFIQFTNAWRDVAWAAIAAAGGLACLTPIPAQARRPVWIACAIALGLAAYDIFQVLTVSVFARHGTMPELVRVWAMPAVLVGAIVCAASAQRHRKEDAGYATALLVIAIANGLLAGRVWFTGPLVTLTWTAMAIGLFGAGFAFDLRELRLSGMAVLAIVLVRVITSDLADLDLAWKVLAFIGVGVLFLLAAAIYARRHKGTQVNETGAQAS